jgi:hypothetical protein
MSGYLCAKAAIACKTTSLRLRHFRPTIRIVTARTGVRLIFSLPNFTALPGSMLKRSKSLERKTLIPIRKGRYEPRSSCALMSPVGKPDHLRSKLRKETLDTGKEFDASNPDLVRRRQVMSVQQALQSTQVVHKLVAKIVDHVEYSNDARR